jgi:hypothetical protein
VYSTDKINGGIKSSTPSKSPHLLYAKLDDGRVLKAILIGREGIRHPIIGWRKAGEHVAAKEIDDDSPSIAP